LFAHEALPQFIGPKTRTLKCSWSLALQLLQGRIHGGIKLLHACCGFVAHMGNAKSRSFDLSVAAVDQKPLIFDQLLQVWHIDDSATRLGAVIDTGEGDRLVILFRE